jgi:multicomponent Na+:H+ antiporter subunit G
MNDVLTSIAVVLGVLLGVLSAVGILRMPDVYIRLQVASKASSLGVALLMLGVAVHFGELGVTVRALLVVVFLFLTAPVAAHVIGRAAYMTGVPLAAGTDPDELAGGYDRTTGRLRSPAERLAVWPTESAEAADQLDPDAAELVADMTGQDAAEPAQDDDERPTDAPPSDAASDGSDGGPPGD